MSIMSRIGLAHRPGTDVEPMCSSCTTRSPSAPRIRSASRSYSRGHSGSYSTRVTVEFMIGGLTTQMEAMSWSV
jgi:hypothetical protein